MSYPVVPEYITVHLGAPDAPAENVTVTFPRYIKGVAASEIYPTWNESAIRANVLAQISVALNRVYTEFYRSRGYDFDITNNTQYDQAFSPNEETFENINAIVDDMFNNYIVRRGNVEPLYTQFCDGVRTQCRGLSQWGSQELAQQGRTPYEILQYYYGQDIDLVYNAPVGDSIPSYPGQPLTVGSVGEDVRTIQRELNRIRKNYPALPAVGETDGVFGADTAAAVRAFQRIFNLTEDGIVARAHGIASSPSTTGSRACRRSPARGCPCPKPSGSSPRCCGGATPASASRPSGSIWRFWASSCRSCRPSASPTCSTTSCGTRCWPSRAPMA